MNSSVGFPGPVGRDPISVLWMTSGLGCDGDSIALTAATNPSLEDLLRGCLPGMPPVILYNSVLAYENGEEFMQAFHAAAEGRLGDFILVLEGSVPNEEINGDGHWAAFGVDKAGEPILTTTWIDRLAPRAAAVLAVGTCSAYGGVPAMRNNPTGAMGLGDYLGSSWQSSRGIPVINLPGCPVQPDNITDTLLCLVLQIAGMGPAIELDDQGRPRRIFARTVHESCDRAGMAEHGHFSDGHGDGRCLVKLGWHPWAVGPHPWAGRRGTDRARRLARSWRSTFGAPGGEGRAGAICGSDQPERKPGLSQCGRGCGGRRRGPERRTTHLRFAPGVRHPMSAIRTAGDQPPRPSGGAACHGRSTDRGSHRAEPASRRG